MFEAQASPKKWKTNPYCTTTSIRLGDGHRLQPKTASPQRGKASQSMLKVASLIGTKKGGALQHDAQVTRVRPRPISHTSSQLVQASVGSVRHSLAGLYEANRNMAAMSHRGTPRPMLQRQGSTQRQQDVGIGVPPNFRPLSTPRGPLPPHMSSHLRPQLDSPRRSYSASAVPTLGSPTLASSPLAGSHLDDAQTAQDTYFPTRASREGPLAAGIETIDDHVGVGAYSGTVLEQPTGRILVTLSVLSMRDTAASLGIGEKPSPSDNGTLRTQLASFRLGSGATTPTTAAPSRHIPTIKQKVRSFRALDVFLVEIFLANRSNLPSSLSIRFESAKLESEPAGVIALDNNINVGALAGSACHTIRARFLALRPGPQSLGIIILRDLGSGQVITMR